jgi:methylated-DNA-[protein]-cysteine S-methyltransferase
MNITTIPTPTGPFTVIVDGEGAVLASGFTTDVERLLGLVHPSLRGDLEQPAELGQVTDAVQSYLDGELTAIDAVPVRQRSNGAFLNHAWDVLREVKPGEPVTYTEFAIRAGRPAAVRAAGQACARNAASLFVPCHRVVASDGSLNHYGWGLPVKEWLLAHETQLRNV